MLKKLKSLDSAGDTIVEVMIVLAVLGMALGIAYATANKSLLNTRQAQENSQASGLVQSQVEALRSLANDPTQDIYHQPGSFCISPTPPYTIISGVCTTLDAASYNIAIRYTAPTFTITATWDDITGQGQDTVSLSYRVFKTTP